MLDEREEEEKKEEEEVETADGINEADVMEVQVELEEGEAQPCDEGQKERKGLLLPPPSLPLQRATSLQDQPDNQCQTGSGSQLTRSYSLEQHPSFRDTCDR